MSPSPHRVLVCLNSLDLGGTQINAVDLAAELRRHGFESHLIGPVPSEPSSPPLFEVAAARGMSIETYEPARSTVGNARQLSRIADRVGAGLVHVYGMWGAPRETYWGPSLLGRRPWVHTVYEMNVTSTVHRHVPLMVGTAYLEEELRARPGKTVLISPPVDLTLDRPDAPGGPEFRIENGLAGDDLVIGIVSRLDRAMKAFPVEIAIDAMEALADTGATLVVVGTGDAEERLRERGDKVNDLLGRTAVRFVGSRANPRPAYAAADVVLGMGGSAARTLAFGKPLVVQGENGWSRLFDTSSAEQLARNSYWSPDSVADPVGDLARVVGCLLRDPKMRAELGRFGREFAVERFGLSAMADRLADLYTVALNGYGTLQWMADLPREGGRLKERLRRSVAGAPAAPKG